MSHLEKDELRRIVEGERSPSEAEQAVKHLVGCGHCRTLAGSLVDELRAGRAGFQGDGSLQLVFDLIERERKWGVESLLALAEWAELRSIPNRRTQRDHVRMTRTCHTAAFVHLLQEKLREAATWDEAEFLAALTLLCIEAMSQRQVISQAAGRDLQAEVWAEIANARRQASEWPKAHQALTNAERHRKEGTGSRLLEARLLSITASTLADEGQVKEALAALKKCEAIYETISERTLLARTLVKKANVLAETEPAKGLEALNLADHLIPAGASQLMLFSEMLRVECLIEVRKPNEALSVFQRSSHLLAASPQVRTRIRGTFTSARLLHALDHKPQAERLFDNVVDRDIEHELYKDAFLDLLYLYGVHVKEGHTGKAAHVCRRALTDTALAAVAHDQLRESWTRLLDATERRGVKPESLKGFRHYLSVHWKNPAPAAPELALC